MPGRRVKCKNIGNKAIRKLHHGVERGKIRLQRSWGNEETGK